MPYQNYLNELTTSGRNELPSKLKIAGIKASNTKKAEMVRVLNEYLSKKENILSIWNSLNAFEKDFLELVVRTKGQYDYDDKKEVLKRHSRKDSSFSYYNDAEDIFDEDSKARLLLIKRSIPQPTMNILQPLVKHVDSKIYGVDAKEVENDDFILVCVGESFEKDFINTTKLANNLKIKTTKENNYPTKLSVIKISEMLENEDILIENNITEIRNYTATTRIFGIISLLLTSKILKTHADTIIPSKNFDEFLKIGTVDRCKMLLQAYVKSKDIDELARIKEIKAKTSINPRYFELSRQKILDYISKSPIDKWVDVDEMLKSIKLADRNFLRDQTGQILTYSDYEKYYFSGRHSYRQIDGRFVEVALFEYLSTIGIVDVAVGETQDDYGTTDYFSTYYYRLTKLGAYVLNVTDEYSPSVSNAGSQTSKETGFTLQANFEIIVPDSALKYKHCMFFDRFAEKTSDDVASIYKLSFKSIVNALDNLITIEEIFEYIQSNCNNAIPENVMLTLKQWEKDSKRIKIRTVTVVETDDEYLMEELKSYKSINNNILSDLKYAFEIDFSTKNKVKREIEKKNRFCIIENRTNK